MQLTCPKCQGAMRQYERSNVVVDQCADCRGIFLDRGELEKLVDAENSWHAAQGQPPVSRQPAQSYPQEHSQRGYDQRGYDQRGYDQRHKKRKSFLGELFD